MIADDSKRFVFDGYWRFDEDGMKDWYEEGLQYDDSGRLASVEYDSDECFQMYSEYIWSLLDDERQNLDIEVDGELVAFGWLGLWNGTMTSCRRIGRKIANALQCPGDCEDPSWYVEDGEFYGRFPHHDGVNVEVYRVADDFDMLCEQLHDATSRKENVEQRFFELTRPVAQPICKVYGW